MRKIFLQTVCIFSPVLINLIWPIEDFLYIFLDYWGISKDNIKHAVNNVTDSEYALSLISVLTIVLIIWWFIHTRINNERVFNTGDKYHEYPYFIYWYASKILGFEKVSLERVPIYMQFKLILRDTFKKTIFIELIDGKNIETTIEEKNMKQDKDEINLVLIDTYEITPIEIPENKLGIPTIIVKSGNEISQIRTVNNKFIGIVREKTKGYEQLFNRINIFATTNTNHTYQIVNSSFKNGQRFGYDEIVVYQFSSTLNKFDKKYSVSKKKFI